MQNCTKITVYVNKDFFQGIEIKHVVTLLSRVFEIPEISKANVFLHRKCELTTYFVQCQCQRQTNE